MLKVGDKIKILGLNPQRRGSLSKLNLSNIYTVYDHFGRSVIYFDNLGLTYDGVYLFTLNGVPYYKFEVVNNKPIFKKEEDYYKWLADRG